MFTKGDKVFSVLYGWGVVSAVKINPIYDGIYKDHGSVLVTFAQMAPYYKQAYYSPSGRRCTTDVFPELYAEEAGLALEKQLSSARNGKKVWNWLYENNFIGYPCVSSKKYTTEEEFRKDYVFSGEEWCRPIPETEEVVYE